MNCCDAFGDCTQGRDCPVRKHPTTRRYPRTMQEAFGPYTDNHIHEFENPLDKHDRIAVTVCLATIVVIIAIHIIFS